MEAAAKNFFSSPQFAVVGASSDPAKFGHIVFKWYLAHSLPCTPINPSSSTIHIPSPPSKKSSPTAAAGPGVDIPTVPTITALPSPTQTALSVITPPKVTSKILREAKEAGIRAVWLQPGSFDQETLDWAKREIGREKVVGGGDGEGEAGSVGGEGWCVLVDGENSMKAAGRKSGGGRL
ncbi:MAG: hypothetical protein M1837_005259 [Sclerophora amabilis]|nr:MAG: hypothetical protein M1837_005259 [Sclerophora amabilis]